MSDEMQTFGKHVVADSGSQRAAYRLRIVDRIRDDEYAFIKDYVRDQRPDLARGKEVDYHTIERLMALAFWRSTKIEERAETMLRAINIFYP